MRLLLIHACAPSDERWRKSFGARGAAVLAWHRLVLARTLELAGAIDADVRVVTTGHLVEWQALAARTGVAGRVGFELDGPGTHDERRQSAFDRAFADGYQQVVMIPGDLPELTALRLEAAFDALDREDACVIGPALDGGVYLVGAAAPAVIERRAALLHAGWSGAGRRVVSLPPLADIDSAGEAAELAARLRATRDPRHLVLRAALANLHGDDVLPLLDAFRACSELDALTAAPTLH